MRRSAITHYSFHITHCFSRPLARPKGLRFFRYFNIVLFSLSMPLLVLCTTFPPKGGNQVAIVFISSVSAPPFGGRCRRQRRQLQRIMLLVRLKVYGFGFPSYQLLAKKALGFLECARKVYRHANNRAPSTGRGRRA